MTDINNHVFVLPTIRGCFGRWVFYSSVMTVRDIGRRIGYANVLRNGMDSGGAERDVLAPGGAGLKAMVDYIRTDSDRFLGSLVVAIYDGCPEWISLGAPDGGSEISRFGQDVLDEIDRKIETVGFLKFGGDEKMFPVDGQHRLAAINELIGGEGRAGACAELDDDVSVLFVAHRTDDAGLVRSSGLYAALNIHKNSI